MFIDSGLTWEFTQFKSFLHKIHWSWQKVYFVLKYQIWTFSVLEYCRFEGGKLSAARPRYWRQSTKRYDMTTKKQEEHGKWEITGKMTKTFVAPSLIFSTFTIDDAITNRFFLDAFWVTAFELIGLARGTVLFVWSVGTVLYSVALLPVPHANAVRTSELRFLVAEVLVLCSEKIKSLTDVRHFLCTSTWTILKAKLDYHFISY